MTRPLALVLSSTLGLGACATTAPGAHPKDMSAADHRAACLQHKQAAAAYDQRAKQLEPGKPRNIAGHQRDEQDDIARQHGDAAKAVDPQIADCQLAAILHSARLATRDCKNAIEHPIDVHSLNRGETP